MVSSQQGSLHSNRSPAFMYLVPSKGQLCPNVGEVIKIVSQLTVLIMQGAAMYLELWKPCPHQPVGPWPPTSPATGAELLAESRNIAGLGWSMHARLHTAEMPQSLHKSKSCAASCSTVPSPSNGFKSSSLKTCLNPRYTGEMRHKRTHLFLCSRRTCLNLILLSEGQCDQQRSYHLIRLNVKSPKMGKPQVRQ